MKSPWVVSKSEAACEKLPVVSPLNQCQVKGGLASAFPTNHNLPGTRLYVVIDRRLDEESFDVVVLCGNCPEILDFTEVFHESLL